MVHAHSRTRILYVLTALLVLACVAPLRADASPAGQVKPAITVRAGFGDDGSYIIGEWFPVRVTLDNPAGASSGRVRVEVDSVDTNGETVSSYGREVDLGSPARKEIVLYAFNSGYGHAVDVRLSQDGTLLKTVSANLNPIDGSTGILLGVVSSDVSALNLLRGEKVGHARAGYYPTYGGSQTPKNAGDAGALSTSHIDVRDIPSSPLSLDNFGGLVFENVDTSSLTAEQQSALQSWVARGGTLVVAATPGGKDATAGLSGLLPVKVGGTRSMSSLQSLSDLVAVPLPTSGSVLVAESVSLEGGDTYARVLASEGGVPLVAVRDLGMGQVFYMALSPAAAPLKGWDGVAPLFKRLLAEHRIGPSFASLRGQGLQTSYGYQTASIFDTYGDVFDLPGLELPSGWLFSMFILVYILVVGPINFIVLRRLRRTELAWATVPALVILFSVGAYLVGYNAKGGDVIMPRSTITYTSPGTDQASGVQMWGLFSPLRSTYNLSIGADSLVTQVNQYSYGAGNRSAVPRVLAGGATTTLSNVVVDTGSVKAFISENAPRAASSLEADLHVGNNLIEGTVRNHTNHGLEDVALVRGDAVQYIGYMAPGGQAAVKLDVLSAPFNNSSPARLLPPPSGVSAPNGAYYGGSQSPEQRSYTRKINMLGMALEPVLTNDAPTGWDVLALAWGGNTPVSIDIEGHNARTEDLNLSLSYLRVSGATSSPVLSSAPAPFWTYTPSGDRPWSAREPSGVVNLSPYADLVFQLPTGTRPATLNLNYSISTPNSLDILAYNVRTGRWDKLGELESQGDSQGTLAVPNPADYAGAGGDFTVRLFAPAPTARLDVQIVKMDLEVNGKQ